MSHLWAGQEIVCKKVNLSLIKCKENWRKLQKLITVMSHGHTIACPWSFKYWTTISIFIEICTSPMRSSIIFVVRYSFQHLWQNRCPHSSPVKCCKLKKNTHTHNNKHYSCAHKLFLSTYMIIVSYSAVMEKPGPIACVGQRQLYKKAISLACLSCCLVDWATWSGLNTVTNTIQMWLTLVALATKNSMAVTKMWQDITQTSFPDRKCN